jgi:hypothetical protein
LARGRDRDGAGLTGLTGLARLTGFSRRPGLGRARHRDPGQDQPAACRHGRGDPLAEEDGRAEHADRRLQVEQQAHPAEAAGQHRQVPQQHPGRRAADGEERELRPGGRAEVGEARARQRAGGRQVGE